MTQYDLYARARDIGRAEARRLSPAHILVLVRDMPFACVEIQTTLKAPRWLAACKPLSRHDARRVIERSAQIPPHFKPIYLQMLALRPLVKVRCDNERPANQSECADLPLP